ncbi:MAG TPA: AAA family ATPase, partial [Candidatus Dormibacteraeota bacterium]|nr:AAA family ATPase [Candidatus Dormibacteraeota bacterium]
MPLSALTSFVGRRTELGQLRGLLSSARLVTITGPGGAGKTRLAEQLASGLARSFDGTAVAYLAAALEPNDVAEIVAAALSLRNRSERPVRAELAEYIGDRHVLLVLDNCEHVASAVAELAGELLTACPRLVLVATSRQPLYVPGEQLVALSGLARAAAVELFVDRARLGLPGLVLDAGTAGELDEICGRLDDMPLALELAAAQVRGLGVTGLRRRLAGHLADLASRSTVGPERQRTLRQTVAWSHELLTPHQAAVWRRLAVFSGGFTLDAAEQVAASEPIERGDLAPILADLVEQSMLIFDPSTNRYRLLEVLREYARERLCEAGEQRATEDRHRRWMVGMALDTDRR